MDQRLRLGQRSKKRHIDQSLQIGNFPLDFEIINIFYAKYYKMKIFSMSSFENEYIEKRQIYQIVQLICIFHLKISFTVLRIPERVLQCPTAREWQIFDNIFNVVGFNHFRLKFQIDYISITIYVITIVHRHFVKELVRFKWNSLQVLHFSFASQQKRILLLLQQLISENTSLKSIFWKEQ